MASITIWNRVEPRARSQDMKAGLEARVHDPLWLLTRQWQVGEFEGRDAGSPVMADITSTATVFDRYSIGAEPARTYDGRAPLEVLVEREKIRPLQAGADLRQAAEAGLQFFRMLDAANLGPARPPICDNIRCRRRARIPTRRPSWQLCAGRVIDGIKLYADLVQAGNALPAHPVLSKVRSAAGTHGRQAWRAWYESLFSEPAGADFVVAGSHGVQLRARLGERFDAVRCT